MIAKLTGTLDATGPDWAVIDVGGVGYLVHCSTRTLDALGSEGGEARVFTDLQVSEKGLKESLPCQSVCAPGASRR